MQLTKQEKIIIALIRGQHIDRKGCETAKQIIHSMSLTLKNIVR
jgi:hypothetical protein